MRMRVPTKTLLLAALWLGPDCIIVEFGPPGDRDRDGDGFTEADGDCGSIPPASSGTTIANP